MKHGRVSRRQRSTRVRYNAKAWERRRHVDCIFVFVHGISVNPKVFKKADKVNNSQGVEEEHEHRLRAGFLLRDSRCGYDNRAQRSYTDGRGHTDHEHREGEVTW